MPFLCGRGYDGNVAAATLMDAGYERGLSELRNFQLRRTVPIDAFGSEAVIIDLLMPREAKFIRNKPPLLADFAVLKAEACRPLLDDPVALGGFKKIAEKFTAESSFGPVTVREFLRGSDALGDMTADQVQIDAFRHVHALLQRLGLWSA